MQIPQDLHFTENHEWVRLMDDGDVRVGITDFAQDALGDVVFVALPEIGAALDAGQSFGEVESTKSVSDVYAPIGGTIRAVNESLVDAPETINSDPYGDGWFIVIAPEGDADLSGLMDPAAYATYSEESV